MGRSLGFEAGANVIIREYCTVEDICTNRSHIFLQLTLGRLKSLVLNAVRYILEGICVKNTMNHYRENYIRPT